ncbi:MAG: hypothetical protein AAGN66_16865 [Acidobacteriota bacterium]
MLARSLYALIHRTESRPSVARVIAPGGNAFGGGTSAPLDFFDRLAEATDAGVVGAAVIEDALASGGALFCLGPYFLDPTAYLEGIGRPRLPYSSQQERLRVLWHEGVWQAINQLPPSTWNDIVEAVGRAESRVEVIHRLSNRSRKTSPALRCADLLARAFVEERGTVDGERLIREAFPSRLRAEVGRLRDASRPSRGEIEALVEAAASV